MISFALSVTVVFRLVAVLSTVCLTANGFICRKASAFAGSTTFFFEMEFPSAAVSYTHLRAHETVLDLVCRLLLEKKKI